MKKDKTIKLQLILLLIGITLIELAIITAFNYHTIAILTILGINLIGLSILMERII